MLSTMGLPTMLLASMLPGISPAAMLPTTILRRMGLGRRIRRPALQIDIHPPLIRLRLVLQSQLSAHLLDPRFDLLHMPRRMVPLPNNDVQMRLALLARGPDALLEHILCFLDVQPVQVNCVRRDPALRVVGPENIIARLVVVLVHCSGMPFALLAQLVGARAIARGVRLVRPVEARAALSGFLAGQGAQAVVLSFGVVGGVIEGYDEG